MTGWGPLLETFELEEKSFITYPAEFDDEPDQVCTFAQSDQFLCIYLQNQWTLTNISTQKERSFISDTSNRLQLILNHISM